LKSKKILQYSDKPRFENWSKNVCADVCQTDEEFCDVVADEIIAHPRISNVNGMFIYIYVSNKVREAVLYRE